MSKSSSQEIVQRISVLQQLLRDMLHPEKFELPDLHQRSPSFISAGFKWAENAWALSPSFFNLIKKIFKNLISYFFISSLLSKGRMKHHPCDNDWIIIYVIGGVTPEEVREAKETMSLFNLNCHVTIAGSRLLNPLDIVDKFLLSSIDYWSKKGSCFQLPTVK